jgi:nicotinamide-nucleotide amidase
MATAEIITIGTEILLGEILDTNARYVAQAMRDVGVDLFRKTTVGDNVNRIAQVIQQASERADIIITTGGLGPTVDDPTREAVALAAGVETEFRAELWEQVQERFRRFGREPTENNKRQAYVPKGAQAIENPVGTAPAFVMETNRSLIISLPGVPREMEHLMQNEVLPYLRQHFHLEAVIKSRVLHTSGAGESQIDDLIGDLETSDNPTVALAAHSGRVDVRITAKAASEVEASEQIQRMEQTIRDRLGEWIYGADNDTLEAAALRHLEHIGWTLVAVEVGMKGELVRRLAAVDGPFRGGEALNIQPSPEELIEFTEALRQARHAEVGLGLAVMKADGGEQIHFLIITPRGEKHILRPYVGPPGNAPVWALNHGLDMIRRISI